MNDILKQSYIYKIIMVIGNFIKKQFKSSALVNILVKEKDTEVSEKTTLLMKLINKVLKILRKIATKIKLDKLFNNSIFAKPIIWVSLVVIASPFLPTMVVLCTVIASALSLLLKAVIDPTFEFKSFKTNAWVFAFIIIVAFCSIASVSKVESTNIAMLVIAFIIYYFVFVNTVTTKKQLNTILYMFITAGTIAALYGLYQYVFGDIYSQAWLDSEMFEDIKMRVYSTFANPNVFGEYLLLVIPISISLLWTEKGWLKKLFLLGCTGICLIALVLTFSRGCWLGIIFSLAILFIIIDKRFILIGVLALCIAPFVLPETIMNRFLSIGNMGDSSTSYRVYIWMGTLVMLKDYWFTGIGLGKTSFNSVYPLYAYNNISAPHSHNLYLQLMVEYGAVGLIVFLGVIYNFYKLTIISMLKKKNIVLAGIIASISGFLLQSMTDHTWYNYRVLLIFWMVIAFGISLSRINSEEETVRD